VKQPQRSSGVPARRAAQQARPLRFDTARLEQFLDLQRSLLAPAIDPEGLPDRLVQGVALFLGLAGAAVGVLQDGVYRVLADHGLGPTYRARYDGAVRRDAEPGVAIVSGEPLVLPEPDGVLHTVLLPFRGFELTGALHLVLPRGQTLPDPDLHLARALAVLAGSGLTTLYEYRRLAQVARLKSDALTAMAHDLRAPLNALIGYASLLDEGAFGPLSDTQRDVSATLVRQARELVDLLGATLDVARLETGQLPVRREEFALGDVLASLQAGTFAQATADGRLTTSVRPDLPRLQSDRVKVKEIVQNLVDNALKHGHGGVVEVVATLAPDRETVRITVRDAGPGIAADLLPHLFERFRPGSTSGTGFGLYLVRSFAEALGGRVAARSLPGEGTAVTVELPLSVAAR
jgi:signal transduction histidine kinase